MIRLCIAIVCASSFFLVNAQNQRKADSVRLLIERGNLGSNEELEAFYWLSIYSNSPVEELKYGNLLLASAEKQSNSEYQIKANLRIGVANRLMGNLGKAFESLFKAADGALGKDEFKALLADIYQEISSCYTQNGNSENALIYGIKTIEILRTLNNDQRLGLTLLNTGYDYYLLERYDSALVLYEESETILKKIDMQLGLAYIVGNRALVKWKQGDIEEAKSGLNLAISTLEGFGDKYGMSDYHNQLGNILLEEGSTKLAIQSAMKGLELAKAEGLKEQIRDASYLLYILNEQNRAYLEALEYHHQYHSYKDSIQNLETTQQLANMRTQFEVGQKQAEVDLLLEQKKNDQIIKLTGGILLIVFVALIIITYFYSKSKTKLNKQLEEQKESLLMLNNTKDKFFSIISHDLRGPVSTLSGLVNVTKYMIEENRSDQLNEMMEKMDQSVDRLVRLLDSLLHWSLQQRGHFPYVPEKVSLKEMLAEANDMFIDMAASKNINVKLQVDEDIELLVDRNTTATIFRNLLNNAIKFTNRDGEVNVVVHKDIEPGMGTVKFIDNGVGIAQDKLKMLFRLNENITSKGTSGEAGLGLGLQLVYDFIEHNKGSIEVESEAGKGSTFSIHLPLANG